MEITEELELNNNCVLSIVYPTKEKHSEDELFILGEMHKKKIEISDAIFVVNVGLHW